MKRPPNKPPGPRYGNETVPFCPEFTLYSGTLRYSVEPITEAKRMKSIQFFDRSQERRGLVSQGKFVTMDPATVARIGPEMAKPAAHCGDLW